ncbi:MAG TPA: beta-ribofuranosylaminobenzene 5'-phosphate synthase family protein [Gemmatimonadales bacterium]|nr:beta-ribofuranosylaminobenzene 5'-phosphate synthase family protein [Gemmatimonadales bacterium]
MTPSRHGGRAVLVEAPARLHFGMLDLRGDLGRRFGGVGAAVPEPSVLLEAEPADGIEAKGPDAARAADYACRFLAHHRLDVGARLRIHRAIPPHAGLGSGTQLALAVGRALAELYDLPTDVTALATAVGRGRRSGVGTWLFAHGGFVLEGGRRSTGADGPAPLLARLPMPAGWHCVIAVPPGRPGLSGAAENQAFDRLPQPPAAEVERVAHLVLMQLLPALAEADLPGFGTALSEIQRVTGGWFAPAQGGAFAGGAPRRVIELLREAGALGVGQSSWGPAVYGLVEGEEAVRALADVVRAEAGGLVVATGFSNAGARVGRPTVEPRAGRGGGGAWKSD